MTSPDPLAAFAGVQLLGLIAVATLGLRDYADLPTALEDAGLAPPRPPAHVVEEYASLLQRLWRGEGPSL